MVIYRNGQEIELTKEELFEAYEEQQSEFDMQDIRNGLDIFDIEEDSISEEDIGTMADNLRHNIDSYEMDWEYARDKAVEDWKAMNL